MKKLAILGVISAVALYSQVTNAAIVSNYENLSTSGASPTQLTFAPGDNVVNAQLLPSPGADSRFFRFSIGNGYKLNSITLDAFTYEAISSNIATGVAFFGLKQGTSISPSNTNPTVVDGYALLGPSTTPGVLINGVLPTDVGDDVFPSLIASGAFTGTVLTQPLPAGDYTVWLRESRTKDTFSLNFKVAPVPVPAAVWLMGSALAGFVGLSKRRKTVA